MIEIFFWIFIGLIVLTLCGLAFFTIWRLTDRTDLRTQAQTITLSSIKEGTLDLSLKTNTIEQRLRALEVGLETQNNFLRDFSTRLSRLTNKDFIETYIPIEPKKK